MNTPRSNLSFYQTLDYLQTAVTRMLGHCPLHPRRTHLTKYY